MKVINVENKKKRRVSKRNKIAWRKHVDITDVEDYLDDQRLEQILGPASEKTNDELFQIDTAPLKSNLTAKQRRKLKISQPAKCYSALEPQSKIADPVGKRSSRRLKEQRQEKMIVSNIIKQKKHEKMITKLNKSAVKNKSDISLDKYDLWNADLSLFGNNSGSVDVRHDSWITGDTQRHLMHGPGKRSKIIPKTTGKKPSGANSIEPPHPGMSYNPSFADHQHLLRTIASHEQQIVKQEQHINRVTKQMFRTISAEEKHNSWLAEMSQGLPNLDPSVEPPTEGAHDNKVSVNPPATNKKKTIQQRKRYKAELQKQRDRQTKTIEKRKITSILRIKHIETHLKKIDAQSTVKQTKKANRRVAMRDAVKRVGRHVFQEPLLEFNMARDIAGNLRSVRKEGNLLADRWHSLQRRNLIEVTRIVNRKKGKVKRFVRAGHKEDWKDTVAKPNNSWDTTRRVPNRNKGGHNKKRRGNK